MVEHHEETGAYQLHHDWDGSESLTTTVITAVATVADAEPTELESIYEHVDPDALNALFQPKNDGTPRTGGRVSFTLAGHDVTVFAGGDVVVRPPEGP